MFLTVYLLGSISQPRYIRNMTPTWSVFGFGVTLLTNGTSEWSIEDIPELDIALHLDVCTQFGLCMLD